MPPFQAAAEPRSRRGQSGSRREHEPEEYDGGQLVSVDHLHIPSFLQDPDNPEAHSPHSKIAYCRGVGRGSMALSSASRV